MTDLGNQIQFVRNLFHTEHKLYQHIDDVWLENEPHSLWLNRAKVISWLSKACVSLKWPRDAFAKASDYLDRYLSLSKDLKMEKLQLVAIGALALSSYNYPDYELLANMTDGFKAADIKNIEQDIIKKTLT